MADSETSYLLIAAAACVGYLLGSIPFGLVLTRLAGLGDIRRIGSGNIGTTNVLRTGRKDLAAATLLLDALKGTVAVLLVSRFGWPAEAAAGLGAFLGHLFPVWLRFKGGKGTATYLGLLLAFAWPVALVFALVWIGVAATTRYSSLSALTATLVSPLVLLFLGHSSEAAFFAILTLMLWFMHRANIKRLAKGQESRIGQRA
jgi:acyl phosphate:glycerol-3-phosphate acyltransferase